MKFKNTSVDYQSTVAQGKKMGFAPEAESFLMDMMSDGLYSDKFGSIVREVASNAFDANVEAGLPDEPVRIDLVKPNSFTSQGKLTITDCGVGICPDRIEDIFTLYFASTKRNDNEMIGGFGIGAKSPFAYTNVFSVETWCNGTRYMYLMEKRGQDRTCTLVDSNEEEGQGTKIHIPIKDSYDYNKFVQAVNEQTLLMRPLAVTLTDEEYKFADVVEFENFYVARDHNGNLTTNKVALGNVVYPIEASEFIPSTRYLNGFSLIPKLEIGNVMPTMSRESLQITDDARVYINKRFQAAINELQELINDSATETDQILEAIRHDAAYSFQLPNTDITIDLRFGGYDQKLVKKMPNKLIGFSGNMNFLSQYVMSLVKVTSQYTEKSYGKGMTWRSAAKSDGHRYQTWVVQNSNRVWNDEKPLFIRWKAEDKLTPADKEYIEDKWRKTNYTSIHFIQRNNEFSVGSLATLVGGLNHEETSDSLKDRLYEKYGKRILRELMDRTEKFEDWKAPQEFVDARKARMKEARKAVTKKDRAKDEFRLRGIGRFGVVDTTLENLQRAVGCGILYLNSKQLDILKEEHKSGNCSWMTFDEWIKQEYETPRTCLFHVSEKTYKTFNQLDVFSNFAVVVAKRAERLKDSESVAFLNRMDQLFSVDPNARQFEVFCTMMGKADKSFGKLLKQVRKAEKACKKRGFSTTSEAVAQTTFQIGHENISLKPILRLRQTWLNVTESKPFLAQAFYGVRDWDPKYNELCQEGIGYIFPNKCS